MLRLENVPPEQMPEVVHIASELYEKDRQLDSETQERQATVDAAKEIGLPEEYLHRAATELHVRRLAQVLQQRRRRRTGLLAAVGAALVLVTGGIYVMRSQSSAPPMVATTIVQSPSVPAFSPTSWKIAANADTKATAAFSNGSATIHVQRFAADSANHFTANLNTFEGAQNLTGLRSVSFQVRGTLPKVRLYLEHGNERWRSPELLVQGQERLVKVDFSQFERQTRAAAEAQWQKDGYQPPETIDNLSFKTGWFVNDIGASGDVTLSDIKFE